MVCWLRRWWRQPDRFDWFAVYLDDRGMQHIARLAVAATTAAFAMVAGAMLWSPAGPHEHWQRAGTGAAATVGAFLALCWLIAWPTLNQSRLFLVAGSACIAAACLTQTDPLAGLTGCYAFVILGVYIAVMHCAKATSYNVAVGLGVAGILVGRVGDRGGDIVLASCEMAILALFSIGAPIALQTMLHIMASDILRSDRDTLTGLLNRRGFYRHTRRLIDHSADADSGHLTITMVDLDHFKEINDTHGHSVGDKALIDVSEMLRHHSGPNAVVARVGGEEFLIADVCPAVKTAPITQLCQAVADTPHEVTASIGTSSMPIVQLDHQNRASLIDRLIAHADSAMYAAKTAGGNQHLHGPPL